MIDILIPILNRPHRVQPLVENILRASNTDIKITFIVSAGEWLDAHEVEKTGSRLFLACWLPGSGDYAKKINLSFSQCDGEFAFLAADDLCFCQGWDTHALATAGATGKSVIGTDDLGNPLVQRGDHATHLLVRRSYIEEQGGSYDGPGKVYCEEYDHQYVDSELVDLAKKRGEWAFSHASKVEHLHTFWGKSERDSTYDKAMRNSSEDHRLYQKRRRDNS